MGSEWRTVIAEDFCNSVTDGTHDSPKPVSRGYFLVTSRHITGGQLNLASAYLISQEDFDEINKRSKVDKWDVLLSMIGTVGEPFLVKQDPNFAIKNIGLFKSRGEVEGKWLYYYLRGPLARQLIRERTRGTTQQYIPLEELRKLPILVPDDTVEMCAIVHILGTLDDKIELNRRMNETLEAIARAIFKSWFVDFDPVIDNALKAGKPTPSELEEKAARRREVIARARAKGRPVGLPEHLARLFPDEFEESKLGWIPKGWAVLPIGEALKVVGGSTPSTKETKYWDGGEYHWATPKDLSGLSAPILLDTERKITKAGLSQTSSGLLPRGTVLMSSRAPVGYLAFSAIPLAVNQGVIAMICDGPVSNYYALNWCYWNMNEIRRHASGTTFAEVSKAAFRSILMVVPDLPVVHRYTVVVRPFYHNIQENLEQSRTLAAIRDALLPKLISGEMRVREAEKFVDQALD